MNFVKISIITLIFFRLTYCRNHLYADPDFVRSAIAFTTEKTPVINIGQCIYWKRIRLGGMVEIRNESRFNQKIFPNHNWRGTGIIDCLLLTHEIKKKLINLFFSLFHESAHPTMGISENTDNAYELIYDHKYRTMMLNSFNCVGSYQQELLSGHFYTQIRYDFYFLSKNTPELNGKTLTHGHGFCIGLQWKHLLMKKAEMYMSIFNRLIFKSKNRVEGNLYRGNGEQLISKLVVYPVINNTYTLSLKIGLNRSFAESDMTLGIFTNFIYGNPYGFIDSRDKRLLLRIGMEVFQ